MPDIPIFDPESPDAEILELYEKVRAYRSWFIRQLDIARADDPGLIKFSEETEVQSDQDRRDEDTLRAKQATTPSGVSAKLTFTIFDRGGEAWAEQGLFEQGLYALYNQRQRLDGQDRSIITAAYELLHIEFEQAFAAWERSNGDYAAILALDDIVDAMDNDPECPRELRDRLNAAAHSMGKRFADVAALNRLMRTLAPDWECYQRKAKVMLAENFGSEAGPWLLRDVNFLTGTILPTKEVA